MTVLTADRVVLPGQVLEPGWVRLEGPTIVEVAAGPPPDGGASEHVGPWLLPGFVDLHVHGGGGHDMAASAEAALEAARFHQRHGTTSTLVSLAAASPAALLRQVAHVADLVAAVADTGVQVLGSHLEGPFLSPARCGAIDARHLVAPDPVLLDELLAAARGTVRVVTIAPELPGALGLIERMATAGVVAALGHTDATYDEAMAGFTAGATLATHLCNAMRPVHHREPGPILAALDAGARCELINDGVHVHPAVVRMVHGRDPQLPVLVTDAVLAAGLPDGEHRFGGRPIAVIDGQVRLADGTLAGSTLTSGAAVARALDLLPAPDVGLAAAGNPAVVVGEGIRRGAIQAGLAADLVVLDADRRVQRVCVAGRWI